MRRPGRPPRRPPVRPAPPLLPLLLLVSLLLPALPGGPEARAGPPALESRKAWEALGRRFFEARPKTRFEAFEPARRRAFLEEARALGPLPEGALEAAVDVLWKTARKAWPKPRAEIDTPYGQATWIQKGRGGPRAGLLLGLHGGGEGAGSAGEAAGNWTLPGYLGMYPQGVRLVHDTWNTVHGEAFCLTLIETAKVAYEIDPDRVVVAGFSMGGTGSFHLAGRHPDLLAAAIPAHGVLMAAPRSQVETRQEVERLQHGLLPNLRNLPVWFYTGLADRNCRPGTFLYAFDRLEELKAHDPEGYADVHFAARPGLAHAFPPGEPGAGLAWAAERRRVAFPTKIVWEHAADPFPLPDAEDKIPRPPQKDLYWLHCERPVDGMYVVATRAGNVFDLSITLAFPEDFTIFLNPRMIDVGEDVVVRVDGREVYRGKPVPDHETVLETLDLRLDRTLVFDRRVRLPEAR